MAVRTFRDVERTQEDAQRRAASRGDFDSYVKGNVKFYKVVDGKNLIRILPAQWDKPPWQDTPHYGVDIYVHYQVGVDKQAYLCPRKHLKKPCPICEACDEAQREGEDEKIIRELRPKRRVMVYLIDRLHQDEGPQLWGIPITVDRDFGNLAQDEDTNSLIYYESRKNGRDIRFYREKTGKQFPEYPAAKMRLQAESKLHEDKEIEAEWLGFAADNPIPDILNFYEYKHIAEAYNGMAKPKSEDDDDEVPWRGKGNGDDKNEKPARSRVRSRAAADDDDDYNKPGTSADAADSDDSPPRGRRSDRIRKQLEGRAAARPRDDDDDEDPTEDEE
jgi:hypothetical protein